MVVAHVASRFPNKLAVASPFGSRTFAELNARVNRLARLLRANGIGAGDSMALVSRNRPAFVEAYLAALRTGIRFTPVNFHLTAEEVGYVVDDCEASVVIYDGTLPTASDCTAPCAARAPQTDRRRRGRRFHRLRRRDRPVCRRRHRRSGARYADAVHVRHHRAAEGRLPPPAAGRAQRLAGGRRMEPGDRRVPVHRSRVSRGTAGVQRRRAPQRGCRGGVHGQMGRGGDVAARRATRRHAYAHGRDDVPSPVAVAG